MKPVRLTHLLIYTDLQFIVLSLITLPKQWYLKHSCQLARLQFIGLFLYSIAKFMKITKLYILKDVTNIMHMWQTDPWTGKFPHRTSLQVVFRLHQQKMWGTEGFYCSLCNEAILYLWPKRQERKRKVNKYYRELSESNALKVKEITLHV